MLKIKDKISQIQKELKKHKTTLILFNKPNNLDPNITYILGETPESCCVILKTTGKPICIMREEVNVKNKNIVKIKVKTNDEIFALIKKNAKNKRIFINYKTTNVKDYKKLKKLFKVKDCSEMLELIRQNKSDSEIKNIKKAVAETEEIFISLIREFKKFKTEKQIADFIKEQIKKKGFEQSFEPIAASGKNSAIPHAIPTNKLNKGFCILDFGVKYKNYCADMTRTIYVGTPTEKEAETYFKVLEVQQNAIKKLKPGKKCSKIVESAHKELGSLSKNFVHGLGHGIGVEIHEKPSLKLNSKDVLTENSVATVEPGIYFKGRYGIRIEDDVLVTKKGAVVLNKISKNLIIMKR